MNAHSLIMIILYLEKTNQPELFLPYFYDSQPCEKTFRAFRSLTTAYSTITNCTVMEALSRLSKINFQDEITHATSPAFVYPRIDKKIELKSIEPLPTPYEIYNETIFAKKCATATAIKLGLISRNADDSYFKCHLKPHSSNIQKKLNKPVNRKRSQNTTKGSKFNVPDLKNIKLKESSIYAEMENATGTKNVFKKSALCWLLRNDCKN